MYMYIIHSFMSYDKSYMYMYRVCHALYHQQHDMCACFEHQQNVVIETAINGVG